MQFGLSPENLREINRGYDITHVLKESSHANSLRKLLDYLEYDFYASIETRTGVFEIYGRNYEEDSENSLEGEVDDPSLDGKGLESGVAFFHQKGRDKVKYLLMTKPDQDNINIADVVQNARTIGTTLIDRNYSAGENEYVEIASAVAGAIIVTIVMHDKHAAVLVAGLIVGTTVAHISFQLNKDNKSIMSAAIRLNRPENYLYGEAAAYELISELKENSVDKVSISIL
jgi:hypothetical protein